MGHAQFAQILDDMKALHDKKAKDYGVDDDPLRSIRGSQDWGIPPWVGAMVRAQDKIRRLQKFARVGHLANESVEDAFMDLAVYAILALILYREGAVSEAVWPPAGAGGVTELEPIDGDIKVGGTSSEEPVLYVLLEDSGGTTKPPGTPYGDTYDASVRPGSF